MNSSFDPDSLITMCVSIVSCRALKFLWPSPLQSCWSFTKGVNIAVFKIVFDSCVEDTACTLCSSYLPVLKRANENFATNGGCDQKIICK